MAPVAFVLPHGCFGPFVETYLLAIVAPRCSRLGASGTCPGTAWLCRECIQSSWVQTVRLRTLPVHSSLGRPRALTLTLQELLTCLVALTPRSRPGDPAGSVRVFIGRLHMAETPPDFTPGDASPAAPATWLPCRSRRLPHPPRPLHRRRQHALPRMRARFASANSRRTPMARKAPSTGLPAATHCISVVSPTLLQTSGSCEALHAEHPGRPKPPMLSAPLAAPTARRRRNQPQTIQLPTNTMKPLPPGLLCTFYPFAARG